MNLNQSKIPPSRWLVVLLPLVAAFFYAPLAFGGVTQETVRIIDGMLVLSGLFWIGLLLMRRRLPSLSLVCVGGILILGALAVLHLANPKSVHEAAFWRFVPQADAIPWLPGTVDRKSTLPVALHLGALLVAGLVLQDGVARLPVRWFLFRVVAVSGLVIALIGIFQKAGGSDAMLWATAESSGNVFFAAFRYHANAASFLNLCWPAAFAVWMRSRENEPHSLVGSFDLSVFFFVFAAVFVNTSKSGHVLGLIGAVLVAWRYRKMLVPKNISRGGAILVGVLLLAVFAVLLLPNLLSSISKWNELVTSGGSARGRLLAYGACLKILPDSGWFGTGPGTFRLVFPLYTGYLGDSIRGFWHHAHQDWLQGLVEWGYLGFSAWVLLFAGAFVRLLRRVRAARRSKEIEFSSSVSLIALVVVLLHALVDFPLQIPAIQLLVVFYLAVAWSGERKPPAPAKAKSPQDAG